MEETKRHLVAELEKQIRHKNQGVRFLIWGIALGVFNLVLDGLYNALLILVRRGDLKVGWVIKLALFLNDNFYLLFIIWLLAWIATLFLVIWGLKKWLTAREEIEVLKLKLK